MFGQVSTQCKLAVHVNRRTAQPHAADFHCAWLSSPYGPTALWCGIERQGCRMQDACWSMPPQTTTSTRAFVLEPQRPCKTHHSILLQILFSDLLDLLLEQLLSFFGIPSFAQRRATAIFGRHPKIPRSNEIHPIRKRGSPGVGINLRLTRLNVDENGCQDQGVYLHGSVKKYNCY